MSNAAISSVARRGFLARLTAAASAAALATLPRRLDASDTSDASRALATAADPDAWIDGVKGRDRLLIHARPKLAPALGAAASILRDAAADYGVPQAENGIAIAIHGPALSGMLSDALWVKHPLGENYGFKDAGGRPVTANPFLRPQEGTPAELTVPRLQEAGVTFVVCNGAVRNLARKLAGENASAVAGLHQELRAGLIPGAILVPNILVSISHAQKRGMGYLFIDG